MRRSRVTAALAACVLVTSCSTTEPPSVATTQPPAPATTTPSVPGFTLIAGGDVLIHPALTDQAVKDGNGKRDYNALFAGVKPAIEQADLGLCHLEVPIATAAGPFKGYPTFNAPPEVAPTLAATGFDVCSTASNHTMDQGPTGVTNTLDALDAADIAHTGSARSAAEAAKPLVKTIAGVKVGFVSYTFGFNQGTTRPSPWMGNLLDPKALIQEAKAARRQGAEVVVASIHWGIEGKHDPSAEQRQIAQQVLRDPNVDLIIGHHAHVVQPFEKINGKWVTYGLGNHIAKHEQPKGDTEEGVLARFRFTKSGTGWTVDQAEYLPTLVDLGPPIRLRDLTSDIDVDAARKKQALDRTDTVVLSRGAAKDGLVRPGN